MIITATKNISTCCRLAAVLLGTTAVAACDLPAKDLGDEGSDTGTGTGAGGACEPGDTKDADDGCNTCTCGPDGTWACTQIGCDGTSTGTGDTCEPGDTKDADDGCNTCVCTDDGAGWACTEIGCDDGGNPFDDDGIEVCGADVPTADVQIDDARIDGNDLVVELGYGGGCTEHLLGACWDGAFLESEPVQVAAFVAHDPLDDACDAWVMETRSFDLTPLAEAYRAAYGSAGTGIVDVDLQGWTGSLTYMVP